MSAKNRQSKDFYEIWNVQTEMQVTQEKWDKTFHNWKEPWKCAGRKRPTGCTICQKIDDTGIDVQGNSFILTIVGDIHANISGLDKFLQDNNFHSVYTVGDICIYPDEVSASLDKKSYEKNTNEINKHIAMYNSNTIKSLPKHVYSLKGNHENFIDLNNDIFKKLNLSYLENGIVLEIGNLVIANLGGIYSPKKYSWNNSALHEYNKRFFTKQEIDSLLNKVSSLNKKVDILITHQAATNVLPELPSKVDEGSTELYNLLMQLAPTYYIHGHHHRHYTNEHNGIKVIGLGNFKNNNEAHVEFNVITKELVKL